MIKELPFISSTVANIYKEHLRLRPFLAPNSLNHKR